MQFTGSCNAETFAIQRNSSTPYRSGITPPRAESVTMGFHYAPMGTFPCVWRQQAEGEVVIWHWEIERQVIRFPRLFVVTNSDNTIKNAWEADDQVDGYYPDSNPIITNYPVSKIPIGGVTTESDYPNLTYFDTLASDVAALGVTPTWMENTKFDLAGLTLTDMLNQLFIDLQHNELQRLRNLTDLKSILNIDRMDRRKALWLRSASMMLYDHRAETMIPLLVARGSYNSTTEKVEIT